MNTKLNPEESMKQLLTSKSSKKENSDGSWMRVVRSIKNGKGVRVILFVNSQIHAKQLRISLLPHKPDGAISSTHSPSTTAKSPLPQFSTVSTCLSCFLFHSSLSAANLTMFSVSSGSIHDVHPSPTQLLITSDQCFFASTIPLLCVSMLECRKSLLFALQKDDDDEYCDANQNFRNGEVVDVRVVANGDDEDVRFVEKRRG
ncbi:unnamed protein product [Vicia faba]|uniref:Uncharacterized protein n=1 Tax=Vicia faba TaxID=3906 RepID=A0AAV1AWY8_VICFA|nr:unnamed protein product [Vicia faba]